MMTPILKITFMICKFHDFIIKCTQLVSSCSTTKRLLKYTNKVIMSFPSHELTFIAASSRLDITSINLSP